MIREHKFVADDAVVEFLAGRTKREREDLLRVFASLAAAPYQKGEWQQLRSGVAGEAVWTLAGSVLAG